MDSLQPNASPMYGRRPLLLAVGLLFVVMAILAAWKVVALRDVAIAHEHAHLQTFVDEQVSAWEDALLQDLRDRLDAAATEYERAPALQRSWRRYAWFDSLFVWAPPSTKAQAHTLYPLKSAPDATLQVQLSLCLRQGERLAMQGASLDEIAAAWVFGCQREPENVRLWASIRAAQLLAGQNRYEDALFALDAVRISESMPLRTAAARDIDPAQLAAVRAQRFQLLQKLGRTDEALALALSTGEQLSELDAPDLAAVSLQMRAILKVLRDNQRDTDADRLARRFSRAERRKGAYEEIQRQLVLERVDPKSPPAPRLVTDQYARSDPPFLLYYGWSNDLGIALSLEQEPLLEDFLRNRMRRYAGAVTFLDAETDRWVAGAKTGGRCAVRAQFARTLRLSVCVREAPVNAAISAMSDQWYVPLVIIASCVAIGLGFLVAVDRAARHEHELLHRQRAFSTRVTHELKTPLAGIKVMAENIEIGAYRDEAHRREMAHRIMDEADQLTRRVDEVLAVARQRTIPKPEPFDPEEAVLMAIDEWGPRMADAGVKLAAELGATDPVTGDGDAFRDAVACLLDNALKYRREGRTDSVVRLELAQVGRSVVVSVSDNGIGVPRAMRKKIFDRFVRVEGPHRGKAGGHGLGLHQVKEIVTAHHGTVTCGEGIAGGASFVIRVPATGETPKRSGRWWQRLPERLRVGSRGRAGRTA